MKNRTWGSLVQNYSTLQEGGGRALNQLTAQGICPWSMARLGHAPLLQTALPATVSLADTATLACTKNKQEMLHTPNKQTSANEWYAKTPASSSLGCCTSEYLGLQSSSGTHMWVSTVTTGTFSRITSKINYLHSYACLRLCFLGNPNQHRFHVTSQLLIICGCLEHSIMKISKAASGFNRNERNSNVGHHHGKASSGPLIRMMKDYIWAYQTKSSY